MVKILFNMPRFNSGGQLWTKTTTTLIQSSSSLRSACISSSFGSSSESRPSDAVYLGLSLLKKMAPESETQKKAVEIKTENKNTTERQQTDAWDEIPLTPVTASDSPPMSELSRQFSALRREQEEAGEESEVDFRQSPAMQRRDAARKAAPSPKETRRRGCSRSPDQWPADALSKTPQLPASQWICCNCQTANMPHEGDCWYCAIHVRRSCCETVPEEETK